MKIHYEKYDDTVRYLNDDKIEGWQPSSEDIVVDVANGELALTTKYESGLTSTKKMSIVENDHGRLIAQHIDEHMGITVFVQDSNNSGEATLTLINSDYIVGRYLRIRDTS